MGPPFLVSLLLAALVLPPPLEQWRAEIEAAAGVPVLVAEVEFSEDGRQMQLAEDVRGRAVMAQYLQQPAFVEQFLLMRGVMVHHRGWEGEAYLILLNGRRRPEWERHLPALVGHELGHAWLRVIRYPEAQAEAGDPACLAVHAGDIVEHVLIRRELSRRGVAHAVYAAASFQAALAAMKKLPDGEGLRLARRDPCRALRQVAAWVDARLGLDAEAWPDLANYEAESRRLFPGLEEAVGSIQADLHGADSADPEQGQAALARVAAKLRGVAAALVDGPAQEP